MSKKGFTLVELLAVIVILAVILVIALPQLLSTIDDARGASLISSAKLIAASAETKKAANNTLGINNTITCDDITKITEDYKNCNIVFDDNGNAQVTIEGAGKFEGKYICAGTKTGAVISDEKCFVEYVSIDEIYDKTNKLPDMLHIGDFVKYDAGKWTQDEIDSIVVGPTDNPVSATNSLDRPQKDYEFGGFTVGTSRNSTTVFPIFEGLGEVAYINNARTNKPIDGWRVYDINEDSGEVTLISAGNPELFYQTDVSDAGYSTPYIFSGIIHSSWGDANANKYLKRSWDVYINEKQGATSAYILTKDDLQAWYSKYVGTSSDLWTIANFQKIYSYPRLHNIIDNYSFWYLSSTKASAGPYFVQGDEGRRLRGGNSVALGVRINIVLSQNAKFSSTRVGTIKLKSDHFDGYGGDQTYNVWDLETLES